MSTQHKVSIRVATEKDAVSLAQWLDTQAEHIEEAEGYNIGLITAEQVKLLDGNDTECEVCGATDGSHYSMGCFK